MDRADAEMRVLSGANAGKVLRFRDAVTIGSARDCHLVLDDPGIAQHHATIEPREPLYRLLAHAPTFIGNHHEQPRAIVDADLPTICMLDFGTTSVMFEICGGLYKGDPTIHAAPSPPPAFASPQIAIELNQLRRPVRGAGVALLDDDRVLIAGGMPPMRGPGYQTAELFSIRAHEGKDIAMAVARRDCCAAKVSGGRILVIGGDTASAELFDPDSETFSPAPSMRVSRNYARMIALPDGRAFVIGGHREVVSEIFDLTTCTWRGLPALRDGFAPVGLCARSDGSVVGVSVSSVCLLG